MIEASTEGVSKSLSGPCVSQLNHRETLTYFQHLPQMPFETPNMASKTETIRHSTTVSWRVLVYVSFMMLVRSFSASIAPPPLHASHSPLQHCPARGVVLTLRDEVFNYDCTYPKPVSFDSEYGHSTHPVWGGGVHRAKKSP